MPSSTDPTVSEILESVRMQYPDVPFLALGQTVFWDEPTKAVWRRLLDRHYSEARLIAGVHDTDYFAKTAAHVATSQPYIALPHDDGRTRDLWSAAGELSSLFGSESVPTRQMYQEHGVPFEWLASHSPTEKPDFIAEKTAAWGWRGIVQTEAHHTIAHDIPMLDIKEALLDQLDWGFAESIACLSDLDSQAHAREIAGKIRGWVTEFLSECGSDCRLSDLYQTLLPNFYELLLASPPQNFKTTASTELFRFNRQTYNLKRFELVGLFLDPKTRAIATKAYDQAVSGSGIYTLDSFGDDAIPFDLVLPGHGRGTVRLLPRGIVIETANSPTIIKSTESITTLASLASLIEDNFGTEAVLVGKAVTLADMIAAEHLVLFHESASGYTPLTRRMNDGLAKAGLGLTLYPIIRLAYPTWDALTVAPSATQFALPSHLAASFGEATVSAQEFGKKWHSIIETQRGVLRDSKRVHSIRDLLTYLEGKDQWCWCDRSGDYEQALTTLKGITAKCEVLRERQREYTQQLQSYQQQRQELERRMGEDWRLHIMPLRSQIFELQQQGLETSQLQQNIDHQIAVRATAFEAPIGECRARIIALRHLIASFRKERHTLERSPLAVSARATLTQITYDAQLARLEAVRNAYLTIEGLDHTHLRPTAWWLPLVDASGNWFEAMVSGTKARFEHLTGELGPDS